MNVWKIETPIVRRVAFDECVYTYGEEEIDREQKVVEEGSTKAERVEIRLKIALKLVDDVDNRNMRGRLKKQIDKIEAAIMDFD